MVRWRCLQPRSRATVNLASGKVVKGLGFLERLDMTLAPWKLPIQELRWGRFLSDRESLVWIDWRGSQACRIVLQNGILVQATSVGENGK